MLELSLFIDIDIKKFSAEMEMAEQALKVLRAAGVTVNGSIKDEDGCLIKYVVNGFMSDNLFRKEVKYDNNNNGKGTEESNQLRLGIDSYPGIHSTGIPGSGDTHSCC